MKKIIIVLVIIGLRGVLLYDLSKKPRVLWSTKAHSAGFLTINSDTEGPTVWVKMQHLKDGLKFREGAYKINARLEGTQWLKIGTAPNFKL